MPTFIVLLGPPGAGKGTQAKVIAEKFGLVHISSGDLFRENLAGKTELGTLAQGYMNRGELVPDDVTIAMIRDRLGRQDCVGGAVLDGFPRTPAQADALEQLLSSFGGKVNCTPLITVPAQTLIDRLSGRWSCKDGHVYHILFNPPKTAGKCDLDGKDLYQRDDDKPETVERRIKVYSEQTAPLIEYYSKRGILMEVDGTQDIEIVTARLVDGIKKNI